MYLIERYFKKILLLILIGYKISAVLKAYAELNLPGFYFPLINTHIHFSVFKKKRKARNPRKPIGI